MNGRNHKKALHDQEAESVRKVSVATVISEKEGLLLKPFSRPKVNWDSCLKEIESTAYNMCQEASYKTALCSHLSRKARKEVMKKENQNKGLKEFRRLISAQIAYGVKKEFNIIRESKKDHTTERIDHAGPNVHNIRVTEIKPHLDLDTKAKMSPGLVSLMGAIVAADIYPEDNADDAHHFENLKQNCLKEIHKVLSKWNKPTVKNFLKSNLFENAEKCIESAQTPLEVVRTQWMPTSGTMTPGGAHTTLSLQTAAAKEQKKDELKDKGISKILRSENSEEILTMYIPKSKASEIYKRLFKYSIDQNPSFPKNFEDIPIIKGFTDEEDEIYENKTYFGDFKSSQYVENGLASYIEQVAAKVKEWVLVT